MATTFTVKPDFSDYRAANWLVFRWRWLSWRTVRSFLAIAIVYFAVTLAINCYRCGITAEIAWYDLIQAIYVGFGAVVGAIVFCAGALVLQGRKAFDRWATADQEVEFTFRDDGFSSNCETGSSNLAWKYLLDFLYNSDVLLLRRNTSVFYLIPTRALSPAVVEEVIGLLRSKGLKRA